LSRRSLVVVALIGSIGCAPLPRDAACEKADACDRALPDPYGSFDVDDVQFGDNGSCWLSAQTAKPCIAACTDFTADQLAEVDADDDGVADVSVDQSIVDACR
jgi:hypothetical protein